MTNKEKIYDLLNQIERLIEMDSKGLVKDILPNILRRVWIIKDLLKSEE